MRSSLRVLLSYVLLLPLWLAIGLFVVLSKIGAATMRLGAGVMPHVYMPIVRAKRWIAGDPTYSPGDTVHLRIDPRNELERARLEAWCHAHKLAVHYTATGHALILNQDERVYPIPVASGNDERDVVRRSASGETVLEDIDSGDHDDRPRAA